MRIKIFQAVMPEFARSEVGTPALAGSRLWIFWLLIIIAAFSLLIIIAAWFCCMLMSSPRYLAHVLARRMIGALCRTILRPVRFIFERVLALPLAIKAEKCRLRGI